MENSTTSKLIIPTKNEININDSLQNIVCITYYAVYQLRRNRISKRDCVTHIWGVGTTEDKAFAMAERHYRCNIDRLFIAECTKELYDFVLENGDCTDPYESPNGLLDTRQHHDPQGK